MTQMSSNPYVGLRPFDVEESILFFGRNNQIKELLEKLHHFHFVAVVGSSGCGKSSLLRAGVIPALKAGYLLQNNDQWLIRIMRPGSSPVYNLVKTIYQQEGTPLANTSKDLETKFQEVKEKGARVLLDILEEKLKRENKNFFLLIDQFEELFRYTADHERVTSKDEATDFVNMMLSLCREKELPIYIVITMRSDFLGDCAEFHGLPEALNESLFLVPKPNRVQLKMAIEAPAKLYGGKLNAALKHRLLNEIGGLEDQLPLLQHAMMRIWDHEMEVDRNGELDMEDYTFIGGLRKALSKHADEALATLDKTEFIVAKELFQALTMIDEHGRKIRRPVMLSELLELTGANRKQLLKIVNRFIENQRSFLILNDLPDSEDILIDISHESLIREWNRLDRWMDEEAEAAKLYQRLVNASELHEQGKKDLLAGSELQLALAWKEKWNPKAVWANRYKKGFTAAMAYLDTSEVQWKREKDQEAERLKAEKRSRKRIRSLTFGIGSLVVVAALFIVATFRFQKLNKEITGLNETTERFARERDSAAFMARRERDEALAQLAVIKGANDSIRNIIENSYADMETKTKLGEVAEKLEDAIDQKSERDIRQYNLQMKIKNHSGDPKVILETLNTLNERNRGKLSPEEMVNTFYYLNKTKRSAWDEKLIYTARTTMTALNKAIAERKVYIGPQGTKEKATFEKYLKQLESGTTIQFKKQ